MTRIRFRKENISIQNIGRQRFWIGIFAGLFSSIIISMAFNQSREVFRFWTGTSADLMILEESELQFFNYFFSILATVLGLSITIWIWMSNNTHNRKSDRVYKQLSRTNALLIFWVILMVIARFGSVLPLVLFGTPGYDNQLNLFDEYWILFVLIPIVVFAQNWFTVRLVYHAGKWIFFSLIVCILTAFTLKKTTTINQEILNNVYFKSFEKDFQYINKEISQSKIKYGIDFDTKAIDILKKWHAESSIEQVHSIKTAFAKNSRVSMDTIILQKIVIHNFKKGGWYYHRWNSLENWHYALPNDILKQIYLFDINSNETKELFKILKEQIDLLNTPKINWNEYRKHTETERRRSIGAMYYIPPPLKNQLKGVLDSLFNDEQYVDLTKQLPELKYIKKNNVP